MRTKMKLIILLAFITSTFIGCDFLDNRKTTGETSSRLSIREKQDSINAIRQLELEALRAEREANRKHWNKKTFVDSFGDPTEENYIETRVEGVFSNSATRNSYLFVEFLFTKKNAGLFLYEYDKNSSPASFIGKATIMLKNSSDETLFVFTDKKWGQIGGVKIERNQYGKGFGDLRDFILNSSGDIRVVVKDEYSSQYNFTINTQGFKEEFELL